MAAKSPRILGVGSSKGGVGKTQTAVTLAHLATLEGYRVLLADADPNLSAADWATRSEGMTFDVDDLQDAGPAVLTRLRELPDYDLVVVDLPGAKSSDAWSALLHGSSGAPVVDGLVVPSAVRTMDLRTVLRVIREAVVPTKVPYLLVGTLVKTPSLPNALQELNEIAGSTGISVARTVIRDLSVHAEAVTWNRPITEMPGRRHSTARAAEREYRNLAREVFAGLLHMKWSTTQEAGEL
ncbi:ParA family protein [Pseudonocardia sp. Ae331_Ps2]|uniref:ParA family protein n=1 Tax=Pseudonocardia sp. Ae331_Ps2 TaxID=1885031 RepID=UPI00094B33B7|nr:ParA family protein [Pseudonocardia sp. Ae331_Ps2]